MHDATFRPLVVAGFLVVIAIVLPHRIKSGASREKLDRTQEGWWMLVTSRSAGLVLWVAVIAYMINPSWMTWSSLPLSLWLRWTGVAIAAVDAGLLLWTLRSLGTNLTDTVVTRQAHTLVVHGPYRWVRHPFYDCVALFILANALLAANWFFVLFGIVLLSLLVVRTRTEEAKLIERFGDAYRAYALRTPRFLPRLVDR